MEMTEKFDMNSVLETFISVARSRGIGLDELRNGWNEERETPEWSLNYKRSLQDLFFLDLKAMLQSFNLTQAALEHQDLVTLQCGLIRAAVFAQKIESTFRSIHEDCYKILNHDKRFSWPEIPEDYQIPDHYNYKGPR